MESDRIFGGYYANSLSDEESIQDFTDIENKASRVWNEIKAHEGDEFTDDEDDSGLHLDEPQLEQLLAPSINDVDFIQRKLIDHLMKKHDAFVAYYSQKYMNKPISAEDIISRDFNCCNYRCNLRFSQFDIMKAREHLPTNKGYMKANKSYVAPIVLDFPDHNLLLGPHQICLNLFAAVYYVPKEWLGKLITNKVKGIRVAPTDMRGMSVVVRSNTLKREIDLTGFALEHFEPSPSTTALMVPPWYTRRSLVTEATGELIQNAKTYKRLIKNADVNLRFDRGNNLPKCNVCIALMNAAGTTVTVNDEEIIIDECIRNHRANVVADRKWVAMMSDRSRRFPDEILVLMFDGMSKFKTAIPTYWNRNAKSIAAVYDRIHYHLHASIICRKTVSGDLNSVIGFLLADNANGNYVISMLYNTLKSVDFIPPHLIFQMDNASINKCRTVLAGLALILHWLPNVEKVTLANYQVGHTHNEVDAFFGLLSDKLKGHDIGTPQKMKDLISSVKGMLSVVDDATVWDFSIFQDKIPKNCVNDCNFFEFTRCQEGIQMQRRKFIRSPDWEGFGPKTYYRRILERPTSVIVIKSTDQITFPHRLRMKHTATVKSIRSLEKAMAKTAPNDFIQIEDWFMDRVQNFMPDRFEDLINTLVLLTTLPLLNMNELQLLDPNDDRLHLALNHIITQNNEAIFNNREGEDGIHGDFDEPEGNYSDDEDEETDFNNGIGDYEDYENGSQPPENFLNWHQQMDYSHVIEPGMIEEDLQTHSTFRHNSVSQAISSHQSQNGSNAEAPTAPKRARHQTESIPASYRSLPNTIKTTTSERTIGTETSSNRRSARPSNSKYRRL